MPPKTDAQKRAQKTYISKFARIEIRVSQEKAQAISDHADRQGESVNQFVNRAIDEAMEREKE